jgi:hypothetical protein
MSAQLCIVCLQPTNVFVTHGIKQFCTSHLRESSCFIIFSAHINIKMQNKEIKIITVFVFM